MFKHNEEEINESVDTIIGPSVSVEGNFTGNGNIIVEGEVKGSLKTKGYIKASETSTIVANIQAGNAEIAGRAQGNIKIKETLDIKETAVIDGDIDVGSVSVAMGAMINGNIKMKNDRVRADNREAAEEEAEEEEK